MAVSEILLLGALFALVSLAHMELDFFHSYNKAGIEQNVMLDLRRKL